VDIGRHLLDRRRQDLRRPVTRRFEQGAEKKAPRRSDPASMATD
jgi:hypothetical protein